MIMKARLTVSLLLAGVVALTGINWNTFMGGSGTDEGNDLALDASGNIYLIGDSGSSWGAPLHSYSGGTDSYIAKTNNNGARLWHTFLGGGGTDVGQDIVLDGNGNIYVTGYSSGTWGSPLRTYGGGAADAFVAKYSNAGALQWNTFLGGTGEDQGTNLALDSNGNVYVTGYSAAWGTPINSYGGGAKDAFIAKLDNSGSLVWSTFLGGTNLDDGHAIRVSSTGDIFVAGESDTNWGAPIVGNHGALDAFVAKVNNAGGLLWNTYVGGDYDQSAAAIGLDGYGNIFITGSSGSWGTPLNPYAGGVTDGFVAKLNPSGVFQWSTFFGGPYIDRSNNLVVDSSGLIYVIGYSRSTWGSPANAFSSGDEAFVAKFNGSGYRLWNTFLGGSGEDHGSGIAVASGKFYVTGYSSATWGSPIVPFATNRDNFLARGDTDSQIFSDVPASYWARSYIERLFNAGITGGCASTPLQYCPENTVNRAQMAVFLLRGIHGSSYAPPAVGLTTGFSDVAPSYWAAAWIKQLAAEGITGGCGPGKYCPENPVTRDQMAVFLLRSEHGSSYGPPPVNGSTGFGDVAPNYWAAAWIKQLVAEGITAGCGNGNYCPSLVVSRAQMAVFLVRTFSLP